MNHQPIILQPQFQPQNYMQPQIPNFNSVRSNRNNRFNNNKNNNRKKNSRNNYEQSNATSIISDNNANIPKIVNTICVENNNKNTLKIKNKGAKNNFQLNENEFPSLNNMKTSSEEPKIVLNENQKMLIKNVGFLKQQVELFYRNDNEEKETAAYNNSKLSFKEALEKPRDLIIVKKKDEEKDNKSRASSTENKEEKKIKKRKKKEKRSMKSNLEVKNNVGEEFKLNNEDFPDLKFSDAGSIKNVSHFKLNRLNFNWL